MDKSLEQYYPSTLSHPGYQVTEALFGETLPHVQTVQDLFSPSFMRLSVKVDKK